MPFLALAPALMLAGSAGAGAAGLGTAASIGLGATAAGSLLSAGGAIQQGNYAAAAANQNAHMLNQQAAQTMGIAKARAGAESVAASREIASARGSYGASGVETSGGSPLAVLHENIRQAQLNSIYMRQSGAFQANELRGRAAVVQQEGQQEKQAGQIRAVGGLLQGVAQGSLLSQR